MNLSRLDAHSHVQFSAYDADRDEVIRRALNDGTGMLVIGTRADTSEQAIEVAERYDGCWATVGLHPSHLFPSYHDAAESPSSGSVEEFDPHRYADLAKRSKKVVAIGEFGLDYFRIPDGQTPETVRARQHEVFRAHLDLAWELGLPVMIHVRDLPDSAQAHADCAAMLEESARAGKPMRGNIHCFIGTSEEALRYVAIGLHVSFTGIATFPPKKGTVPFGAKGDSPFLQERLIDVAAAVPLDRLLIETDAPYLAPVPHRGARNEPSFVKHVAEAIATRRLIETAEVERATLENARRLFGIEA